MGRPSIRRAYLGFLAFTWFCCLVQAACGGGDSEPAPSGPAIRIPTVLKKSSDLVSNDDGEGVLLGRVLNYNSLPVAVYIQKELDAGVPKKVVINQSEFRVSGLSKGRYAAWAEGEGQASIDAVFEIHENAWLPLVTLPLKKAETLRGKCQNEAGEGIECTISAFADEKLAGVKNAQSDAGGRFSIGPLLEGGWTLAAEAEGYHVPTISKTQVSSVTGGVAPGDSAPSKSKMHVVTFADGGRLAVQVNAQGNVVPDARVVLVGVGPSGEATQIPAPPRMVVHAGQTVGSTGGFASIGELGVMPSVPPIPLVASPSLTDQAGQGTAMPSAKTPVSASDSGFKTDATGFLLVEHLPIGVYTAVVSHPNFARGTLANIAVKNKTPTSVVVNLSRGAMIIGTVTDGAGAPVFGADISAAANDGFFISAITGEDGRYSIGPLAGEFLLTGTAARLPRVVKNAVVSGTEDLVVDWVLSDDNAQIDGGYVVGTVEDRRTGVKVSGAVITLTKLRRSIRGGSGESTVQTQTRTRTSTDSSGGFSIGPVASGRWALRARAKGYAGILKKITVGKGDQREQVELGLERGAVLGGIIRDENGERVAGAIVKIGTSTTTTDKNGVFRVDDADTGNIAISASNKESSGDMLLEVSPGDEFVTLELRIYPIDHNKQRSVSDDQGTNINADDDVGKITDR